MALLGPLPYYISLALISGLAGVIFLLIYKYTSNQKAIGKARDQITANLLAVKIFNESISVTLNCQGKIILWALKLLLHSIIPALIMIVPVVFILSQLGGWYQNRPIHKGEEFLVSMSIKGDIGELKPQLCPETGNFADTLIGPVRVLSEAKVYWKLLAKKTGDHTLKFYIDAEEYDKSLIVGEGLKRISVKRPGTKWYEAVLYPFEKPFDDQSQIKSIDVEYIDRKPLFLGLSRWILFFFIFSFVCAFLFKGAFGVRI